MNQFRPSEFVYQVFALLFAVILVHGIYVAAIRPAADAQLAEQAALAEAGEPVESQRSLVIVIRDFEQEACFILMLSALAIMAMKGMRTREEMSMLGRSLIDIPDGTSLLPQDAREYSRSIESLPESNQEFLLPRALTNALGRFATTGSIPAVSEAVK